MGTAGRQRVEEAAGPDLDPVRDAGRGERFDDALRQVDQDAAQAGPTREHRSEDLAVAAAAADAVRRRMPR